jgi:hypothetical protein
MNDGVSPAPARLSFPVRTGEGTALGQFLKLFRHY